MNMKIAVLATDNCIASQALGIIDFFDFANTTWTYLNPGVEGKLFQCHLYGNTNKLNCSNGFTLPCGSVDELEPADGVIMVASYTDNNHELNEYLYRSCEYDAFLKQSVVREVPVASYCSGTFALAHSGILDNQKATTVWWMKNLFERRFSSVELVMDELVVESGGILTGGATTAFYNVCLLVMEKLTSPEFASQLGKVLLVDRHRLSQQAYMNPELLLGQSDELVGKIQKWIQQNFDQPLSLEYICDQFALTKRTLIRRFKAETRDTPMHYLQKIRVERAKSMLETTSLPVERIVEKVGYEDTASFRKLFLHQTQLTPRQYRQRFAHHLVGLN